MIDEVAVLKDLGFLLHAELTNNILPYWSKRIIDEDNGGFIARVTYNNIIDPLAPKGSIFNARLLWTFSASYRFLKSQELQGLADRAYHYLIDYFLDKQYGGVYWMLTPDGEVLDDRKHIYAQSFAIYALTEYYRAFEDEKVLDKAVELYNLIESKSTDRYNGGYFEAFSRNWELHHDFRLSDKDVNEPKSMNTHLHLLEAYTNLYRCTNSVDLREKLISLTGLFLDRIIAADGSHLVNFLDEDWTPRSDNISFGHDIETSWLLMEASDAVADKLLSKRVTTAAERLCRSVMDNGVDSDGGLMTEASRDGITNDDKEWWPQGEAVVGFLNIYGRTGKTEFLEAALSSWNFISKYIKDLKYGDWLGRVDRNGKPYQDDKVSDWKCCYHNARTCLEVMARTNCLLNERGYEAKPKSQPS